MGYHPIQQEYRNTSLSVKPIAEVKNLSNQTSPQNYQSILFTFLLVDSRLQWYSNITISDCHLPDPINAEVKKHFERITSF